MVGLNKAEWLQVREKWGARIVVYVECTRVLVRTAYLLLVQVMLIKVSTKISYTSCLSVRPLVFVTTESGAAVVHNTCKLRSWRALDFTLS
jgi:hypothetical protein